MIRKHVVWAVFKRNFISYFSSPTGYVFIAVFAMLSAAMALWPTAFFTRGLANLQTLNELFPYLLLFFVPAVAMGTWSEERKQGTEELLLTLPVRDLELVLGKFLAAQGVYTVALVFALTDVLVLFYLGSPDLGMMFGNYLAFWFLGGALLSLAMVASQLTSSMTVAFILGALFCAVPVFLGDSGALVGGRLQSWLQALGVREYFLDFSSGVLTLHGLVYFLAFIVVMLYANLMLLGRRHIRSGEAWGHRACRAAAILVIGICVGVLSSRTGVSGDVTMEQLHTLTKPTRELLGRLSTDKPVMIQAYVSPEVPPAYVEARETLLSMLRDFRSYGRGRVHLQVYEAEPFTQAARDAEEKFGIRPVRVALDERRTDSEEIFLGVGFTCGLEETVIPFLHKGLSVEYELTRSIGVVTGEKRKRVGVAATDAKVFGGMDFQTFQQSPEWRILSELKKQYEVVQVSLDAPVTDKFDALLVVLPSSLTQPQMDVLMAYVKTGAATLLFDDPSPEFNRRLAPLEPKPAPGGRNPMFGQMQPPTEPKGDVVKFLETIGFSWTPDSIAWDKYNPHPRLRNLPWEVLFVGPKSGGKEPFHSKDPITSGLQEMVTIFGGEVRSRPEVPVTFTALLTTSPQAGLLPFGDVWKGNPFFGTFLDPDRIHRTSGKEHVLAARVQGTLSAKPAGNGQAEMPVPINVLFCADVDCISDVFFTLNEQDEEDLDFDNVTFVLNAVDVLAGDLRYVEVRKRRPRHRTLDTIEQLSKNHQDKMEAETKAAEEKAKQKLKEAQERLTAEETKLKERKDIDEDRMDRELAQVRRVEQARFDAAKKTIEDEKKAAIHKSRRTLKEAVRGIQNGIKVLALVLAPLPALAIAIVVFMQRLSAQRRPL